ncbi:RNB-like protein [Dictyocaulus viviparus]|uniref:RNB-like protein n=1 Tax=Dictyocaulus viviparus TaxID=29172 RepID=A0A0D8XZB9_DICVI|nr:RNB-like protein [Dictyocaulus viviparus]
MAEVMTAEPSSSNTSRSSTRKRRNFKRPNKSKESNSSTTCIATPVDSSEAVTPISNKNIQNRPVSSFQTQSVRSNGVVLVDDYQKKVRTGKVPVNEVMGPGYGQTSNAAKSQSSSSVGQTILHRLIGNNVDPEAIFTAALRQMPQVPGFPSVIHRPDSGPHSTVFRPELFKTTMEAYASASAQCGTDIFSGLRDGHHCRDTRQCGRGTPLSPDFLLPWVNFSPMFPLDRNISTSGHAPAYKSNIQGGNYHGVTIPSRRTVSLSTPTYRPQNNCLPTRTNTSLSMYQTSSQPVGITSNQKTRKPYFMPYMSVEAVTRGLANGDLIKGSLCVNQRNYEESYVDNPDGDDQLDLLILGVHDRNRALHGDVVIVRVKERMNWVIRENLYQAWRAGHLNVSHEDNGQPITIPPVAPPKSDDLIEVSIGGLTDSLIRKANLNIAVPPNKDRKYSRQVMVIIGAQLEIARRECIAVQGSASPIIHPSFPSLDVQKTIDSLSIARIGDLAALTSAQIARKIGGVPKRTQIPANGKRSAYRTLSDMSDEDWGVPDVCLQKTAEVMYIMEMKNCRAAMGQLKMMTDGNRNWALFSPTDSRMPRMMIPADQLPPGFFERPQDFAKYIFVARMVEWQATAQFARGKLERTLGVAGDVESETEGLLFANNIDTREFSVSVMNCLPIIESKQWTIDEKEFKYRRDLRDNVTFTISAKNAHELNCALSIDELKDCDGKGTPGFEVGVHVADVSHFVFENTELDTWAANRACTVNLVHKSIPMLPRVLTEDICSLLPGKDRLTFSIIWKMDKDGSIIDEWFGRTIIKSHVQLEYDHVQGFIEEPEKILINDEYPEIHGVVSLSEIRRKVMQLHMLARRLRTTRVKNGALRIEQPKLVFTINSETKLPFSVNAEEPQESHKLAKEFMLLANVAVATKIESHFPRTAFLRRHSPPKQKVLREVLEVCEKIGFPLDAATSARLASSLSKFQGGGSLLQSINQVLSMLLAKPMQMGYYMCAGSAKNRMSTIIMHSMYHCSSLSNLLETVNIESIVALYRYTHFTAPLRRYADIIVHRQLAAALGYSPPTEKTVADLERMAQHCNDKKLAAKAVSDSSDDTFFGLVVKQNGPIEARGVVVSVMDASFDVLVLKYGVVKRVYVNRLDMARDPIFIDGPPAQLTLFWNPPMSTVQERNNAAIEQTIQMCTVVDVVLTALPEPTKYQALIRMRSEWDTHTLFELMENKD